LLVLRHERLPGLSWATTAAVDAAWWPLARAVQMEGVPDDLGPDAQRT
jgi:hypothetical protein